MECCSALHVHVDQVSGREVGIGLLLSESTISHNFFDVTCTYRGSLLLEVNCKKGHSGSFVMLKSQCEEASDKRG